MGKRSQKLEWLAEQFIIIDPDYVSFGGMNHSTSFIKRWSKRASNRVAVRSILGKRVIAFENSGDAMIYMLTYD